MSFMKFDEAQKVRKGMRIWVDSTVVEVTKREKWNSTTVKIHFKDCGDGLPIEQIGLHTRRITERFYNLTDKICSVEQ